MGLLGWLVVSVVVVIVAGLFGILKWMTITAKEEANYLQLLSRDDWKKSLDISEELERRTGKRVSLARLFSVFDHLESQGLIVTRLSNGLPGALVVRGGVRSKECKLTDIGYRRKLVLALGDPPNTTAP